MDSFFCGQKFIVDFLRNQLDDQKRLIQSLLFYGPSHLGKFYLALNFCQALICEKKSLPSCGHCSYCHSFSNQNHPDLAVFNKEKGIDASRAIINFLSFKPQVANLKMVIIEGFDQFSEEAQNALLKILEEPPFQSLIILIAEEPEKILLTIRSRILPLRFRPVSQSELSQWLIKEKKVEPALAEKLALISRGRPGLALELLKFPEKLKEREQAYQLFFKLMQTDFFSRSKIIREITGDKEGKNLNFYLHLWLEAAEDDLIKTVHQELPPEVLAKKSRFFKNLLKYHRLIDTTNINRLLILEKLFLEYEPN